MTLFEGFQIAKSNNQSSLVQEYEKSQQPHSNRKAKSGKRSGNPIVIDSFSPEEDTDEMLKKQKQESDE